MQLSGEGLLPFGADKQTAFVLAVFNAFQEHTGLYALNVTDVTLPPTAARRRCFHMWASGLFKSNTLRESHAHWSAQWSCVQRSGGAS